MAFQRQQAGAERKVFVIGKDGDVGNGGGMLAEEEREGRGARREVETLDRRRIAMGVATRESRRHQHKKEF